MCDFVECPVKVDGNIKFEKLSFKIRNSFQKYLIYIWKFYKN